MIVGLALRTGIPVRVWASEPASVINTALRIIEEQDRQEANQ